MRPAEDGIVPGGPESEVREAKRGKLDKVRALHGGRVALNGDADTDNWEDASVLIAVPLQPG